MRWLLLVSVATACSGRSAPPEWPDSAGKAVIEDWRDDGGESIEPKDRGAGAIESKAEKSTKAEKSASKKDDDDEKKDDDEDSKIEIEETSIEPE